MDRTCVSFSSLINAADADPWETVMEISFSRALRRITVEACSIWISVMPDRIANGMLALSESFPSGRVKRKAVGRRDDAVSVVEGKTVAITPVPDRVAMALSSVTNPSL